MLLFCIYHTFPREHNLLLPWDWAIWGPQNNKALNKNCNYISWQRSRNSLQFRRAGGRLQSSFHSSVAPRSSGRGAAAHRHPHRGHYVLKIAILSNKSAGSKDKSYLHSYEGHGHSVIFMSTTIEGKDNLCSLSINRKRLQWPWDDKYRFIPPYSL